MITVVLDTNVLIGGTFLDGADRKLFQMALEGRFETVTSPRLLQEFEWVLEGKKFHLMHEVARTIRAGYQATCRVVTPREVPSVSRDPDDDHVIAAAVEGKARYIVSNDSDLLILGQHLGIEIIRPREFLAILKGAERRGPQIA